MSFSTDLFKVESQKAESRPLPVLYKFHPTGDYLNELIDTHSLHLTHQSKLNDIFECRYKFSDEFLIKMSERSGEKMRQQVIEKYPDHILARMPEEQWKALSRNVMSDPKWQEVFYRDILFRDMGWGICSFTEDLYNDVMWGNYADKFKGVCLEFDFRKSALEEKLAPVEYDDKVFIVEDKVTDGWYRAALIKKTKWSYEQEWRTLYFPGEGKITFEKPQLTGIYFGSNTTKEVRDVIVERCKSNEYFTNFYVMKISALDNKIFFFPYDPNSPEEYRLPEYKKEE